MSRLQLLFVAALLALIPACKSEETIKGSGCEGCHRPADRDGLEEPHPLAALDCAHCHGGNPEATSIAEGHVTNVGGDIRDLGLSELLALDPAYRRFVNPSDLSAAGETCGTGDTCHKAIVDSVQLSTHATMAGVVNAPRITNGLLSAPSKAVVSATDPNPDRGLVNAYDSLAAIGATGDVSGSAGEIPLVLEHIYGKACSGCHINAYGAKGVGRSDQLFPSGCAACHQPYSLEALGNSKDPTQSHTEPGHPLRHSIERFVADSQCEACHYKSLRIATQFRGLREITRADLRRGTDNMKLSEEAIHGHPAGFYVIDDDTRDSVDTTPPDVHAARGMSCVDCHMGSDVHGDGHLRGTLGPSIGIDCKDCHGSFERVVAPQNGAFLTTGGATLERLRKLDDGRFVLTGALDGREHPVTQVSELRRTPIVNNAHSEARHGDMECFSCHTAWMQNIYLGERVFDLRAEQESALDGSSTKGTVTDINEIVVLDAIHLGINDRGKIGPFMIDNTLLSVIVDCDPRIDPVGCEREEGSQVFGRKVIDHFLPKGTDGKVSISFIPVFAHTTAERGQVQPCERCHPRQYEVDPTRPRVTFGLGGGVNLVLHPTNGSTKTVDYVDVTRVTDDLGASLVPFPHPRTKPVPPEVARAALNYEVVLPLR